VVECCWTCTPAPAILRSSKSLHWLAEVWAQLGPPHFFLPGSGSRRNHSFHLLGGTCTAVTVKITSLHLNFPSGICMQLCGSYEIWLTLFGAKRNGFWTAHAVNVSRTAATVILRLVLRRALSLLLAGAFIFFVPLTTGQFPSPDNLSIGLTPRAAKSTRVLSLWR